MNPSEPGPREPEAPAWFDRRLNQTVMSLLAFVLAVHIFEHFAVILQQLLVAVFIAYLLLPVRHWLGRYRVPTLVAYSLIAAGLFGMTLGLAAFIRVSLQDLQQKLPDYRENLVGLLRDAAARVPGTEPEDVERFVRQGVLGVRDETAWVRAAVGSVFDFTTQSLVVLVYLLFILAEQASIRRRLDEAFEPGHAVHVRRAIQTVNEAIAQYIWVKTFVSVLTGLLSGVALYLFGVDYPVLWGVLTFLLNYIPYLGALVAMVLPLLLSLVQFESVPYTFAILAVLTVIQNGIGYGIEPFMTSARVNLSPLVIIVSLAFWGWIWGVVGMILAVPLMVVVKVILENIPSTRAIARLMGNPVTRGGREAPAA